MNQVPESGHEVGLRVLGDERGSLVAIEQNRDVPFDIQRVYYIYGTAPNTPRGFHAHRRLQQFAVCIAGSCTMILDDGSQRVEISLNRPDHGIHIGPMIWHEMTEFSQDCVLLVLADAPYEEADYIRNYDEFCRLVAHRVGDEL